MRRGITQEQVTAADALVVAGDKPTVDKIRARLGTGSPNTVTRMLDVWRQGLAVRLHDALSLPELPADVGNSMTGVWRMAVEKAAGLAQARLTTGARLKAGAAQAHVAAERNAAVPRCADLEARLADRVEIRCAARILTFWHFTRLSYFT
jgi:hypothetical protein